MALKLIFHKQFNRFRLLLTSMPFTTLSLPFTLKPFLVKELCKADGQVRVFHGRFLLPLDRRADGVARQDGVHLEVKIPREHDQERDDE